MHELIDHVALATRLHRDRLQRAAGPMLTVDEALTLEDAYAVQAAGIELRLQANERITGGKLGFTSEAMRRAMGVDHPNYGWLTDAMWIHDGVVDLGEFIHPKVEPELAFLLGARLESPVTSADVRAATVAVMPCLEVVDSRFIDFRFTALDNIADNSSAGAVALGDPRSPVGDLRLTGVAVYVDGELHATAAGAAAHDDPAAAVAWMVNACDRPLEPGDIVISGGLTAPVTLTPGMVVTAEFDRYGSVKIRAAREGEGHAHRDDQPDERTTPGEAGAHG